MLERFRSWYLRNYDAITWFLIGFLVMAGLSEFGQGNWPDALVCWVIAAINYWWIKSR